LIQETFSNYNYYLQPAIVPIGIMSHLCLLKQPKTLGLPKFTFIITEFAKELKIFPFGPFFFDNRRPLA